MCLLFPEISLLQSSFFSQKFLYLQIVKCTPFMPIHILMTYIHICRYISLKNNMTAMHIAAKYDFGMTHEILLTLV